MPDSLNKLFLFKTKALEKIYRDQIPLIISQQADDTRKVKKGTYRDRSRL